MKRKTKKQWVVPAILMVIATVALLKTILYPGATPLSAEKIYGKICWPLLRLLFFLGIGLLVGQFLEASGWTSKLGQWVRPITRWAHLKNESGAAFVSSFVSGIVANTLLMNFHSEKTITRKELILTYLLNTGLPLYLVHLPTTFVIVGSLAGRAGIVYMCIGFTAACLRSLLVLVYSHVTLPVPKEVHRLVQEPDAKAKTRASTGFWKKVRGRFARLVMYTAPIYVLIFLLNEWGLFVWLRKGTAGWISGELFPVEAAGVVVFALAAEFSSGMAAAGALVNAGALTVKQTVIAIMLGTIVATPIRAVRHQLPTHAGIFSLGLGTQLLMMSQAFRIVTLVLVTIPYVLWG
jgi:hypothetical protein